MLRLRRQAVVKPTPVFLVVLVASLLGCQRHYPEGGYSCQLPQRPGDCPPAWYCRADLHCYSSPDETGATADAAIADAALLDAARVDASGAGDVGLRDAWSPFDAGTDARECVAETCDAVDNDCDGAVDEELATISAPRYFPVDGYQLTMVPTSAGWGVVYEDASSITNGRMFWVPVSAAGDPMPAVSLGDSYGARLVARAVGDAVVLGSGWCTFTPGFPSVCGDYLQLFRSNDGARIAPPGQAPYRFQATGATAAISLGDVSPTRASVYIAYGASAPYTIRRYRMAIDGASPTIAATFDVGQVSEGWWDIALVGDGEVVVAESPSGLQFFLVAADDGARSALPVGPLTGLPTDSHGHVALAVPDASMPLSTANPLAVAMMRPQPNGIVVAVITGTTPLSQLTPVSLPGSSGAGVSGWIRVVRAPGEGTPRFYVAALDYAGGTSTTLRVWELVAGDTTARMLPIADDWVASRGRLDMAVVGDTVRILEENNASQIVTRTIGCH